MRHKKEKSMLDESHFNNQKVSASTLMKSEFSFIFGLSKSFSDKQGNGDHACRLTSETGLSK